MRAVDVHHLSKTYDKGKTIAVDDLSFHVEKGEIFGLIGPDGAGKTSVFRILTTLLLADQGSAQINGLDVIKEYKKIRQNIGYMPGRFSLYSDLTVAENLTFFATLFNTTVEANYALIKDIYEQLAPFSKRRAGNLSGGMKQKLALCCALIHQPSILFLDEPTTGVDPVSRKEFWNILSALKAHNMTILVSTPYMDEAVRCDRIALLQQGKALSIDSPKNIIAAYPNELFALKATHMYPLLKALRAYPLRHESYPFGEFAHLSFEKPGPEIQSLLNYFKEQGLMGLELTKIEATIEDCFIHMLSR